ncbi:MAG TPA: ATP-binding protein, partial [Rhizomicrobium sp.]
ILRNAPQTIATMIGCNAREVLERLRGTAPLVLCGLLKLDEDSGGFGARSGFAAVAPPLRQALRENCASRRQWIEALTGPAQTSDLGWGDFAHLGEAAELARKVLAGAAERKAPGVNLLVHGPVGTGKTEFCKALAAAAGLSIWAVADKDEDDGEPTRSERLASLRLLQRLLSRREDSLVLFDEAEDLLEQPGAAFRIQVSSRNGSKVHINRLLERNAIPVIWTCNEVDCIDPAVLRRMTMAVEVKTPSKPARTRIWRRALDLASVALEDDAISRLATRFEAPAGIAANAAKAAALADGGEREIEHALTGLLALVGSRPAPGAPDDLQFDNGLVNCAENIAALTERLARAGAPLNWSMCLSGPPGTGKSAFARHLAGRIGLDAMHRRASDLLSMWVGESEKQIARAFADARNARAMLILDEADSLLAERRGAVRSWEVTQVNEMLTWMENHPFPFVCTTNMMERLDRASLRRFTLKLRFEALTTKQAREMFAHAFGRPAPRALCDALTPGDFANVRRRLGVMGAADGARLADWLTEEAEARGVQGARIGFAA